MSATEKDGEVQEISFKDIYINAATREVTHGGKPLTASAQPELLVRAVGNVVRNAVRYAGHAGPITVTAKKNGEGLIHLTIADQGGGVPEDALDNLFDPFYRIETDRAREPAAAAWGWRS
jgi:two-component system, OmpR family, sensor histidine kinase CpxA